MQDHVVSVAIVGSRKFKHLEKVRAYVRGLPQGTLVVSGGCKNSPDVVAEEEAKACEHLPDPLIFRAEWYKNGKLDRSAGFRRNPDIVRNADRVVAFWDGSSSGTANTIDIANRMGKPVEIISDCGIEIDPPF